MKLIHCVCMCGSVVSCSVFVLIAVLFSGKTVSWPYHGVYLGSL